MPQSLIEEILGMNRNRSVEFLEAQPIRQKYREDHPTEVAATLCMDGRVNLTRITQIPFGIVTPFRNIGGRYRVGWPLMRSSLEEWYGFAQSKGRQALLIGTFHFSESSKHLGCAGFGYDTESARASARNFLSEVRDCYRDRIWTVLVGIETDGESLLIVGDDGVATLNVGSLEANISESAINKKLRRLLPSIPGPIRGDLIPLIKGNAIHTAAIKRSNKPPIDMEHRERVLAIGQGFDWLKNNNFALVMGPCDPDLDGSIVTAAKIIQGNWKAGRIPHSGVLLVSTPYRQDLQRAGAIYQSKYLAEFALKHIRERLPDMNDFFQPLIGVINYGDRRFEQCD